MNSNTKDLTNLLEEYFSKVQPKIQPKVQPNKQLNIFKSIGKTASYIYTIDLSGVYYFAFARKVPFNTRKRYIDPHKKTASLNTGAAKTDKKYCGKWTSFGGSANKHIHALKAAIQEINEEGCLINPFIANNVNIKWENKTIDPQKLNLMSANSYNNVGIFLFYLKDYERFFNMFPKLKDGGRRGPQIVQSSHGEIDAVCSLNYKEILDYQNFDKTMFIHYACESFNKVIKPNLPDAFQQRWNSKDLSIYEDDKPRTPFELKVKPYEYVEYEKTKYK
jgi:hypothetical protein